MYIDSNTAHAFLEQHFNYTDKKPENYVRLQVQTSIAMDDISKKATDGLVKDGDKMWDENKEQIIKLVHLMVDDKFGQKRNDQETG